MASFSSSYSFDCCTWGPCKAKRVLQIKEMCWSEEITWKAFIQKGAFHVISLYFIIISDQGLVSQSWLNLTRQRKITQDMEPCVSIWLWRSRIETSDLGQSHLGSISPSLLSDSSKVQIWFITSTLAFTECPQDRLSKIYSKSFPSVFHAQTKPLLQKQKRFAASTVHGCMTLPSITTKHFRRVMCHQHHRI